MEEDVALAFIADVEEAVANVRELQEASAQLAETAEESSSVAEEAFSSYVEASSAATVAATDLEEASARLAEVQADAGASAEDIADAQTTYGAALDRASEATIAAIDAQERLAAAEGEAAEAAAASAATQGEAAETVAAKDDLAGDAAEGMGAKYKLALVAVAVGAGLAVKGAMSFQQATTRLVTTAGESAKNLTMVQQGILGMTDATNQSVTSLSSGMYMVESAGFHGAAGLEVLKAAGQGAAMEQANLYDVANAVTSGLNAYGLSASHATSFTQQMLATVGQGKMTMEDLASSLSAVLPFAAAAHISFDQVGGALATMTGMGMSAQQSTQDLANVIRNILKPSGTASAEMRALGLNANEVSASVGKVGLTGVMQEYTDAILKNTSGGMVMLGYMKEMTPQAQGLAREIMAGTISTQQLRTAVYGLNPEQAKLISLFETAATSATGLKQTYAGAMAELTGGATGLNVALMLTGSHAKTFADNVKTIGAAAKTSGSDVAGWGAYQKQAGVELSELVKTTEAMGDELGLVLLPALEAVLGPLRDLFGVIARNRAAAIAFALVIGTVLSGVAFVKLKNVLTEAKDGFSALYDVVTGLPAAASSVVSFASTVAQGLWRATVATGTWIAEHAVATAQFIAQNIAQAASAMAAFVAENLATLGIGIAIVALIAVIVLLATHWKEVWSVVKTVGLDAWHFIDGRLIQPFMAGADELVKWVDSHWRLLAAIISTVLLGPAEFLISFIAARWAEFARLTSQVTDAVTGYFGRLPGRILSQLAALPAGLYNMGRNIVMGLIHGIEDQAGPLLSYVGGLAGDVEHTFASALHIFSPSRVFFMHGVNTMLGYINGVKSMAAQVKATMAGVGGQVAAAGTGTGAALMPAGSTAGGRINVTVPLSVAFNAGTSGLNSPQFYQYIQAAVQEAVLRWGLNNPGTGFVLPGRAG